MVVDLFHGYHCSGEEMVHAISGRGGGVGVGGREREESGDDNGQRAITRRLAGSQRTRTLRLGNEGVDHAGVLGQKNTGVGEAGIDKCGCH